MTDVVTHSTSHLPVIGRATPYVPADALTLTVISGSLSIFGAVVIFWTFFRFHDVRHTTSRLLLLFLTIADLMTAVGNLVGTVRYAVLYNSDHSDQNANISCTVTATFCVAQSFWTTYSSICSFFWTAAITIFFYVSLIYQKPTVSQKLLKPFHIVCWGFPGVICVVAVRYNALGDDYSVGSGAWCWINGCLNRNERIMWMVVAGKGWEILTYLSSFMLLVIFCFQRRNKPSSLFQRANDQGSNFREEDNNFFFIPVFLYLLRMWGTIRFFIASFRSYTDEPSLDILQSILLDLQCIGDSGQAFFNFVLFCLLDRPVCRWIFSRTRQSAISSRIQNDGPGYGSLNNHSDTDDQTLDDLKV